MNNYIINTNNTNDINHFYRYCNYIKTNNIKEATVYFYFDQYCIDVYNKDIKLNMNRYHNIIMDSLNNLKYSNSNITLYFCNCVIPITYNKRDNYILSVFNKLKELNIITIYFNSKGYDNIIINGINSLIKNNTNITNIVFNNDIINIDVSNNNIKILTYNFNYDDSLINIIKNCQSLTEINILKEISDECLFKILENKNITKLNLNLKSNEYQLLYLCEYLKNNNTLQELILKNSNLIPYLIKFLSISLVSCKNLKVLDLSENNYILNEGLFYINQMLKYNTSINNLNLNRCYINNKEILTNKNNLQNICIENNCIEKDDIFKNMLTFNSTTFNNSSITIPNISKIIKSINLNINSILNNNIKLQNIIKELTNEINEFFEKYKLINDKNYGIQLNLN